MQVERIEQNRQSSDNSSDALSFTKILEGFDMNNLRQAPDPKTEKNLPQVSLEGASSERGGGRGKPAPSSSCEALQDQGYKIDCPDPKKSLHGLDAESLLPPKAWDKEVQPWKGTKELDKKPSNNAQDQQPDMKNHEKKHDSKDGKDSDTCTKGPEKNPESNVLKKTPEQMRR